MTTETATVEAPPAEGAKLLDLNSIELTEQEAVAAAIDGLRELIEHRYHFCNRYDQMFEGRIPHAVRRDQNQRILYLAVIKKLEGLAWWDGAK